MGGQIKGVPGTSLQGAGNITLGGPRHRGKREHKTRGGPGTGGHHCKVHTGGPRHGGEGEYKTRAGTGGIAARITVGRLSLVFSLTQPATVQRCRVSASGDSGSHCISLAPHDRH